MAITSGVLSALETTAQGEILNRIVTQMITLDVTSIKTRVYVLERVMDFSLIEDLSFPIMTVSIAPELASDFEGPVNTSTVHYPVLVAIIWGGDRGQRDTWAERLEQRQAVARDFRKTRPVWAEMVNCSVKKTTVKSGEPYIDEAIRKSLDAQYWLVDVQVTEPLIHA